MAFFFKKNEAIAPEPLIRNFPNPAAPPVRLVTPVPAETTVPSAEGLAIAQRLSGVRIAVPAGFRVRAEHFQLEGGCVVAGELQAQVVATGRSEIAHGGCINGDVSGGEISVKGLLVGQGCVDRLTIQSGGECRGSFCGGSLVLNDGGIFEGEYARKPAA